MPSCTCVFGVTCGGSTLAAYKASIGEQLTLRCGPLGRSRPGSTAEIAATCALGVPIMTVGDLSVVDSASYITETKTGVVPGSQ